MSAADDVLQQWREGQARKPKPAPTIAELTERAATGDREAQRELLYAKLHVSAAMASDPDRSPNGGEPTPKAATEES